MKIFRNLGIKVNKFAFWIIDFLIPKSKRVEELENIKPEEFLDKARPSLSIQLPEARAMFSYKDPLVKDAIWLLKYRQNKKIAKLLAILLGNVATEWLEDLATFENFDNPILVPIPMGKIRKAKRGANHCETLCEEMLKVMPLETTTYASSALSKIKETESQAKTKNRAERLKNLSGSFKADSKIVRGRNILLIDDVITTGATIDEARRVLLLSGASKIYALSIAH